MGIAPPKRIGQQQIAVVAWNPSNSKGLEGGLAAHKGEADTSIEFVRAVREILVDLKDLEVGSEDRGGLPLWGSSSSAKPISVL